MGAGAGKWDALDSVSMFQLRQSGPWMPRFVAAFHRNSGQDRVRRSWEEGADGLWWLIFPQQAGAGGKATHRGR